MPRRKRLIKAEEKVQNLNKQITETVSGLTYLSETDAEIVPFAGKQIDSITIDNLLLQTGKSNNTKIEEKDFNEFFAPLIKIQDWFGEEERKMTEKFVQLKDLLQENLRDLKVFRIGKKEIEIFVVGLDSENVVQGIQTRAVET